jgi:hypothetical protein
LPTHPASVTPAPRPSAVATRTPIATATPPVSWSPEVGYIVEWNGPVGAGEKVTLTAEMTAPAWCSLSFKYATALLSLGTGTAAWDAGKRRYGVTKTWTVPLGVFGPVSARWTCTYQGVVKPADFPWTIAPPPTPAPSPPPDWTLTWRGTPGVIGGHLGLTLLLSRAGADCQVQYVWPSGTAAFDSSGALGTEATWFWAVPLTEIPGYLTFNASCTDWEAGRTHGISGSIAVTAP